MPCLADQHRTEGRHDHRCRAPHALAHLQEAGFAPVVESVKPDGTSLALDRFELKPSNFHAMLMDLKRPIKEGEIFKGTLTFEKAGTLDMEYSVEGMGAGHDEHGG